MHGTTLAQIYCAGGALLGLWAFVRFPSRAPETLPRSMLALIVAVGVIAIVPTALGAAVSSAGKAGGVAGLLAFVLPALTGLFWSTACVFRAFCGLMGGGGTR